MTGEFESLLEKLITLMVDKKTSASVSVGIATNIDKIENTCDVTIDGLTIHGVRLQAVINENSSKVISYPVVDSQVLVIMIGKKKTECFLLACSEVEEFSLHIGGQTLIANKDGFVFNGGTAGMVKVDSMVSWMDKVLADLNTLKTLLSTSLVAGNGAPLGIVFNPSTPTPQESVFENIKIKH